jgi:hypothetical protein
VKYLIIVFLLFSSSFAFSAEDASSGTLGSVFDALTDITSWFSDGLYDAADNVFQRMAAWVIIWILEAKLFMLGLGIEIAELFIEALGISDLLNSAFSSLDSKVSNFVYYLKIPEAINILISAYTTRFVMSLV